MNVLTKKIIGVFCLGAILLTACAKIENANQNDNSATNQTSAAQQATKDDVEELGRVIKLPFTPEETT